MSIEVAYNLREGIIKKTNYVHKKHNFLESVGVIGYEKISTAIFSSIFTGFPICLLGPAGTAKTFAVNQIATCMLGYSSIGIDSSKANWEELVGPYNFKDYMENEKISYLNSPQTLWNKEIIFWDEINRGGDKIQNGALEVTRNKRLMGMPLDVEINMAACNPLGYQDTRPLNEALADRFLFVVDVPTLHELGEEKLMKVAQQAEASDDKRISKFTGLTRKSLTYPNISEEVNDYLKEVGKVYSTIHQKLNIVKYCTTFCLSYAGALKKKEKEVLKGEYLTFEGRRFNYLIKGISAYLSFELYEYFNHIESLPEDQRADAKLSLTEMDSWLHNLIYEVVLKTINTSLTGKKVDSDMLLEAHNLALQCISSDSYNIQYKILKEHDVMKRFFLSALYIDEEPLAIYDSYDLLVSNLPSSDTEEAEDLIYKYDENKYDKYDYLIPLLMLYDPVSPLHSVYKKLSAELRDKIKELVSDSYTYEFLETVEDFMNDDIIEYFARKNLDIGSRKKLSLTHTDDFLNLSKDEQLIREMAFRRFLVDNGQYFMFAAELGAKEQAANNPAEKPIYDIMAKEAASEMEKLILPNFQNSIKKTHWAYRSLKEVLDSEGKTLDSFEG